MKYFVFNIIILMLGIWFVVKANIKQSFYQSYILRKIAQFYFDLNNKGIFSSVIAVAVADCVYNANSKKQEDLIKCINANDYIGIIDFLSAKNKVLSYAYGSFFNIKEYKKQLQKHLKQYPDDLLAILTLGLIYDKCFETKKLKQLVEKLQNKKIKGVQNAVKCYLLAKTGLYDADMHFASQNAMKAIKLFKKYKYYYEEADSYMLLGEIYRVSAVFDLSQMMFDSAEKIYESLDNEVKTAEIKALKGMLYSAQERFDEAKDMFSKSKDVFSEHKLVKEKAEIANQQALLSIMQKKYAKALKYTDDALLLHERCKNHAGEAFSYELKAIVELYKKRYAEVYEKAQHAMKNYTKVKNYSGFVDSAYIAAQAKFELGDYEKTEELCRQIIDVYEKYPTCFHIANVYSLLGLVYIKQNDYNRASALLKKSMSLEQCNDRYVGVATDCMNLALIERKLGRKDNVSYYLNSALENAIKHQNQELIDIIKHQIEKNK